ncbi:Acyltransferase family protein [Clostridiales bacterium CHKCI001]|nr:Acyltransferase family protein [Clostridiales bacterium CHKCI001]
MEQEEKETGRRKSNLELLRIVSMVLIVAHHYSIHGGFILPEMNFNKALIQVLSLGGKLGVDCFVLITGYFMIESKFRLEKAVKLWAQIWFYSILFMTIFYGFGIVEFNADTFIKNLMPITYSMYWFATTYLVLYILTLFLNPAVKAMSRKRHLALICTLGILWSVLPTVTNGDFGYSTLGLFILLYLIGGYIRLYPNRWIGRCRSNFLFGIIMYGIIIVSAFLVDCLESSIPQLVGFESYLAGENKITTILCAIGLFLGFKNLRMRYHPWLNRLAASMFSVYLIQENSFIHPLLWSKWFKNRLYSWSSDLWIHAIVCIAMVIVICTAIDQIRIYWIERPIFGAFHRRHVWERAEQKLLSWQKEEE